MIAMLKKTNLMPAFCVLFMLGTGMSQANAALEIVAKVNGKAITNYQVDQRAAFLRMVTDLEDTAENHAQIKKDATQMLIDEILKLDAAAALGDRFDSWESIANNYLSGRILWLTDKGQWTPTPDPSQQQFQQVADELLADPTSPWNRASWDRSAGVMVDGERLA